VFRQAKFRRHATRTTAGARSGAPADRRDNSRLSRRSRDPVADADRVSRDAGAVEGEGVGYITALTFVLTLGNKERFGRSRDVGCYLGLRPRRSQSGERDPQLSITKAGNIYLGSLLIECANHILRPQGRDSSLRQWGAASGSSRWQAGQG